MQVLAEPAQLIPPDASWRYLAVVATPPPPGWTEPGFDDASWAEGRAGFSAGYSGYQQGGTVLAPLPDGMALRGLALRCPFRVTDPASVLALFLRVEFEDGLIAWLNGVEVVRQGFEGIDPVPWDMLPAPHPVGAAELIDLTARKDLLRAGTNVLALQVFEAQAAIPTLFVWPELRSNFLRGPFVQNVSSNQAVVVWRVPAGPAALQDARTVTPSGPTAEGSGQGPLLKTWIDVPPPVTAETRFRSTPEPGFEYAAVLRGLQPDRPVNYSVTVADGIRKVSTTPATINPLRPSGDADFVVIGDTGSGQLGEHLMNDWLNRQSADLILHVGDLVYPSFTAGRVDLRCFSEFENWMRRLPLFPTPGNHDQYGSLADYADAFSLPTNQVTGTEFFYSFDHGDAHFVSLFVPWWGWSQLGVVAADGSRSAQYGWLTNDLASTQKPWKIVFFHQAMKTSGEHAVDDYDLDGRLDTEELQDGLLPMFREYGVQVVFNGHDHLWERFAPTNGVHIVVTGGGGAPRYPVVRRDSASAQVVSRFHALRARLRKDTFTIEAVDPFDVVFDRYTIRRAVASDTSVASAWHTPAPPPALPENSDGNRPGEVFDFTGNGVAGVSGLAANPGELFVNDDLESVHIGLRDVMLWPAQTLALFIDSPRRPGVARLEGVGGEIRHPLGLLGLEFSGFTPAIVCLLGDEFADDTLPNFVRSGSDVALGQGVFALDPGLTPVPGCRVQQFNRSPESDPDPAEANADFMIVSLPRSVLGGVLPGDELRVAAVVLTPERAGNGVRLNLDTAFVGRDLRLNPDGSAVLESLPVTLAAPPDGDVDLDGLTAEGESAHGTDPDNPDTDGDGLPDGWEVRHQLDPVRAMGLNGADGDPDGDGYRNLEEYLSDTDPQDPAPTLKITALLEGAGFRVDWRAMVGRTYSIEGASDLSGPWELEPLAGFPRVARANRESVLIPFSTRAPPIRWFRIRED